MLYTLLGRCSNSIHVESDLESDTELAESPFTISATSTSSTPKPQFSTLSELLRDHKRSLKLVEGNVKRITVRRDEFWKEAIVTFKNPEFDYTATPRIVFEGEAGVDAKGLRREYGALLCQAIFCQQQQIFLKVQRTGNCQSTLLMVFTQGCLNLLAVWWHILSYI